MTRIGRHLLSIDDLDRAAIERILDSRRVLRRGRRAARSRRCRRCAGGTSSTSSTSPRRARARASSSPPSGCRPTWSAIRSQGSASTRASRCKDTVADAVGLRPGRDRDPLAPRRRRRSSSRGWTAAAVINAGDGKHEHPTQALLDVFTLRRRLGSLDGAASGSSATCSTRASRARTSSRSRRWARSVTVCGPPTLLPREIEALGCEATRRSSDLGEADVVYVLRMQHERMQDSFVPSLREYAARYQITTARLRPGQLLMHPGPVNRGVELSADAIDSPQALIGEQVKAGRRGADGRPLRVARRSAEPGGGWPCMAGVA